MCIWFYLFAASAVINLILTAKIIITGKEIKNINSSLKSILKSDTNMLITINSNDKNLKKLASDLNKNLKELRKSEIEYKNGNQELKSSITNISHDLRTPLTAIRGYIDLMEENSSKEKQQKYLNIINNKVKDLTELTEQLFDFSKSMDLQNDVQKENVCINRILEDTLLSFYAVFKEHNINPEIKICERKIIKNINKNMLKRVFENIISNAVKYGENDFKILLKSDGIIEFSNKAENIDIISIKKIFNRYYTVKNAEKSNGIGLAIAKQLVELMDGNINAELKNSRLIIKIEFPEI